MKKCIVILFIGCLAQAHPSGATGYDIDSLRRSLARPGTDTVRARQIYLLAAELCIKSQLDSGYHWYKRGLDLCRKNEKFLTADGPLADFWILMSKDFFFGFSAYYARSVSFEPADSLYRLLNERWTKLGAAQSLAELKESYTQHVVFAKSETDKAIRLIREALAFWEGEGDQSRQSVLYAMLGRAYLKKNDYPTAMGHIFKSLELAEAAKNEKLIGSAYHQLGNLYKDIGNYKAALDLYLKALPYRERGDDPKAVTGILINLGITYMQMGDNGKALGYHWKAYRLCEKQKNWMHQTMELNNMAIICMDQGKFDTAISQLRLAVKIRRENADIDGVSWYQNALGDAFLRWNKPDSAVAYYLTSMQTLESHFNPDYRFRSCYGLAAAHQKKKSFTQALGYAGNAKSLAAQTGSLEQLMGVEEQLSSIYRDMGDYHHAYDHYLEYIRIRDSITNDDKSKELGRLEAKSEFDKQQAIAKAEHQKELEMQQAVSESETRRKNVVIAAVAIGLGIVVVFAVFIFNRLRVTRRQKQIIEMQKTEVEAQKSIIEDKNKEIIDSINYAKRIQQSLLPTERYIEKALKTRRA